MGAITGQGKGHRQSLKPWEGDMTIWLVREGYLFERGYRGRRVGCRGKSSNRSLANESFLLGGANLLGERGGSKHDERCKVAENQGGNFTWAQAHGCYSSAEGEVPYMQKKYPFRNVHACVNNSCVPLILAVGQILVARARRRSRTQTPRK